ncbi:MAG TPA: trehalose-6-phosphate synthase [Verrucomicrobiae bacterium]|jgi:alpha,alpha-trehalose-phosphate synthase [UDP-forming]|nr:trehalose-6-phosphate synthase [Verrucomicrobiae bacterium]
MRLLSVRLIVSLLLSVAVVSLIFSYYDVRSERNNLRGELVRRADVLAESLAGNVAPHLGRPSSSRELQLIANRFSNREHLAGVAVYDPQGVQVSHSAGLPTLDIPVSLVASALAEDKGQGQFLRQGDSYLHVYVLPVHRNDDTVGALAIVHDAKYIDAQSSSIWRKSFLRILAQVFLVTAAILLVVHWSIAGPIARAAQWMRAMRTGTSAGLRTGFPDLDMLKPLAREVTTFAESLNAARTAAEKEAQLREAGESLWTSERLSVHVRGKLGESRLFVVSNREPYTHVREGKSVQVVVPPSGLVTALEPVLRACDGEWIAHGNGNADRETVDHHDRLRVPPEAPKYSLRRVWLTKEEEEGYYYGFANEGLWPLCHIAHTRPIFRGGDWEFYRQVNHKFAATVLKEMAGREQPVLLAQDYHFALLPRLVKKERPDARIAIFWHIPWPNPEAFAICPWQRELLDGLLGADLIGFHIQSHCTNFLQTVDRALECRIDWERHTVTREDHETVVKAFPISVEFTEPENGPATREVLDAEQAALLRDLGVEASLMGIGVDRVDYTKGIPERFLAIERFLERHPSYQGRFTFVQIGAPSRTHIRRYHDLQAEVESEADRINWRFQSGKWRPIVFLKRQHSHAEIQLYYRAADLCMVTSLHDGMNLVAKEFVAARHDEQGVLILSRFTGAARELRDALLVNPYDIDHTSEAIHTALTMGQREQTARMHALRKVVREQNVYRWAGNLLADLCEVRLETAGEPEVIARSSVA